MCWLQQQDTTFTLMANVLCFQFDFQVPQQLETKSQVFSVTGFHANYGWPKQSTKDQRNHKCFVEALSLRHSFHVVTAHNFQQPLANWSEHTFSSGNQRLPGTDP